MFQQVYKEQLCAGPQIMLREVNDDVITFRNTDLGQRAFMLKPVAVAIKIGLAIKSNSMLKDVAVIRDHMKRNTIPGNVLADCALDFTRRTTSNLFNQR